MESLSESPDVKEEEVDPQIKVKVSKRRTDEFHTFFAFSDLFNLSRVNICLYN